MFEPVAEAANNDAEVSGVVKGAYFGGLSFGVEENHTFTPVPSPAVIYYAFLDTEILLTFGNSIDKITELSAESII